MKILVYAHGQMVAMKEDGICSTMGVAPRMITMGVARRMSTVPDNHVWHVE